MKYGNVSRETFENKFSIYAKSIIKKDIFSFYLPIEKIIEKCYNPSKYRKGRKDYKDGKNYSSG